MNRLQEKSLPLFSLPDKEPTVAGPGTAPAAPFASPASRPVLWLAVNLPRLGLEVFGRHDGPLIVVTGQGAARRVWISSDICLAAGIRPGMGLNAAFALAPDLRAVERSPLREQQALERIATRLGRFSPRVSCDAADMVLLEVQGSLRLFGGLERLCGNVRDALGEFGYTIRLAIAPTPLAAAWLARAGEEKAVLDAAQLPGRLGRLSLSCLDWPSSLLETLAGMGIDTLADCLRLPRDGFARRLGQQWLDMLDRALGRQADPRQAFVPPPSFQDRLELDREIHTAAGLMPWIEHLLSRLQTFLLTRQLAVERVTLELIHADHSPTRLPLGLANPSCDAVYIAGLVAVILERLALPAPVSALHLHSGVPRPLRQDSAGLLDDDPDQPADRHGLRELVGCLRVRLGNAAVYSAGLVAEHRPEAAWRRDGVGNGIVPPVSGRRPVWILDPPRSLEVVRGRLWHQGYLDFEAGPERIETGWWDNAPVSRDYYTAVNPGGARFWIYRERRACRDWFLHGVFG
jgi:protein ImuB